MIAPLPSFDHLATMSDDIGTFEHADHTAARRDEGYCTDDMARLLVAVAREPQPEPVAIDLGRMALRFIADAQGVSGRVRNRRAGRRTMVRPARRRGLLGAEPVGVRHRGAARSRRGDAPAAPCRTSSGALEQRSPWPRAMAFAALGAAEVLAVDPGHDAARALLADTAAMIGPTSNDGRLAVAGTAPHVRQRRAARRTDRRRRPPRPARRRRGRPDDAALAARSRDRGRTPLADGRRRSRTRRPRSRLRSAADRGRCDGRRLRPRRSGDR